MNLQRTLFLTACLALAACDSESESTSSSGSTTGDDGTTGGPSGVTISASGASVSATNPTTDPGSSSGGSSSAGESTTDESTTGSSETTAADSTGTAGDETAGEDTTTGSKGGTTIYDVQDGTVAAGEVVTIEGVVITGLRVGVGVVVQEIDGGEHSGVYVDTGDIDLTGLSVGDIVDLSGTTTEDVGGGGLADLTAILADTLTATGDTMKLTPEVVDFAVLADPATAEPWESVLVSVQGNYTAVTFGTSFGQFGEFAFQSGEDILLIDNFLYAIFAKENAADFPGFDENATFTGAAGILNYSYGNFKIAPRTAAELSGYMAPPV